MLAVPEHPSCQRAIVRPRCHVGCRGRGLLQRQISLWGPLRATHLCEGRPSRPRQRFRCLTLSPPVNAVLGICMTNRCQLPAKAAALSSVGILCIASAASSCARAIIVDWPVRVQLSVTAVTPEGETLPNVRVGFWDGLWEEPLGSTDAHGILLSEHTFLWGHRAGQKNPPPPEFHLVFRRPGCRPYTLAHTLRESQQVSMVDIRAHVRCERSE